MADENTGGLRKAVDAMNKAIKDLTSLHVQTYTGTVDIDLQDGGFDKVRAAVESAKNDANVEVTLVAEAYYQFDGDSYNFLASGDVPARALELHKSAVEAGMATRRGLLELVKDIF